MICLKPCKNRLVVGRSFYIYLWIWMSARCTYMTHRVVLMYVCSYFKWNSIFTANSIFSTQTTWTIWCMVTHAFAKVHVIPFFLFIRSSFLSIRLFIWNKKPFFVTPSLAFTSNRIISGRKFRLHVARTWFTAPADYTVPLRQMAIVCLCIDPKSCSFQANCNTIFVQSTSLVIWYANQSGITAYAMVNLWNINKNRNSTLSSAIIGFQLQVYTHINILINFFFFKRMFRLNAEKNVDRFSLWTFYTLINMTQFFRK